LCIPFRFPHHGSWPGKYCKPHHGRGHDDRYDCACDPPRPSRGHGPYGSQGGPGSPGYNALNASVAGQKLPEQGVPPAAPLMAICGLVILVSGTVLRRIVLRAAV
jgi:hypothetical protein